MMYIIYNHDGSIKTLIVDESIQQNNNGVNQIFVSIEGYETTDYTCVANFELPDGTLNSLVGVADVGVEVGELAYDGFVITLTNAQTLYPGKLKMSIKLVDLQDRQLCTYQTELQVNPSSAVPSETFITNAQYNSLIQSLQSYVLYADLVNYADKEWVVSQLDTKQKKLYRHHFRILRSSYQYNFELINDNPLEMTLTGGTYNDNHVLSFASVDEDFKHLKYLGTSASSIDKLVLLDFSSSTIKFRFFDIQNDGTLEVATLSTTTLTDTVEEL